MLAYEKLLVLGILVVERLPREKKIITALGTYIASQEGVTRECTSLTLVVRPQDQENIFQRDHDRQGPQHQGEHLQQALIVWRSRECGAEHIQRTRPNITINRTHTLIRQPKQCCTFINLLNLGLLALAPIIPLLTVAIAQPRAVNAVLSRQTQASLCARARECAGIVDATCEGGGVGAREWAEALFRLGAPQLVSGMCVIGDADGGGCGEGSH